MKTAIKLLGVLAVIGFGLSATAQYVARPTFLPGSTYVNVDVGGSFQQDITSKSTGAAITFNPGIRTDVSFGYHISDPVAAEFETGMIWNSIDKSGGVKLSDVNQSADWFQFPFLANLIFSFPTGCPFRPYIGGGIGGVVSSVRFDNSFGHTHDSDFVFAYDAMVGGKYSINEQMDVGLAYKFLGTSDHNFSKLSGLNDSTFNHSIVASFTYRF